MTADGYFARSDGNLDWVHSADVSSSIVPVKGPSAHRAIAGGEELFGLEARLRRRREEPLPEAPYRRAHEALAVGWGHGVLEDTVRGHQRHDGIHVVSVEGIVEPADDVQRLLRLWVRHGGRLVPECTCRDGYWPHARGCNTSIA